VDRSFYLENFGCRATQADGAAIERQLLDKGLERAEDFAQADVVVLNTCTVTSSADQDARATIRRIHRENPAARILVTGCYAQRAPEEIAQIPGVSVVVGNSHKTQLADIAGREGFVSLSSVASPTGEIVVGDMVAGEEISKGDRASSICSAACSPKPRSRRSGSARSSPWTGPTT
jgi:threonylcarbamoyladenosine tRNA methylthiotransferase MtaB